MHTVNTCYSQRCHSQHNHPRVRLRTTNNCLSVPLMYPPKQTSKQKQQNKKHNIQNKTKTRVCIKKQRTSVCPSVPHAPPSGRVLHEVPGVHQKTANSGRPSLPHAQPSIRNEFVTKFPGRHGTRANSQPTFAPGHQQTSASLLLPLPLASLTRSGSGWRGGRGEGLIP